MTESELNRVLCNQKDGKYSQPYLHSCESIDDLVRIVDFEEILDSDAGASSDGGYQTFEIDNTKCATRLSTYNMKDSIQTNIILQMDIKQFELARQSVDSYTV